MTPNERAQEIVFRALTAADAKLGEKKSREEILSLTLGGSPGGLDSLVSVALVIEVEWILSQEQNLQVRLTDMENEEFSEDGALETVGALVGRVAELLEQAPGEGDGA